MDNRDGTSRFYPFFLIWTGQVVSVTGSTLTSFALGVWIYQQTDSAMYLAINTGAFMIPEIILMPLAGVLVDRWDRRVAMVVSDLGCGLSVLSVAILYMLGWLEPWNIYVISACIASFSTLRWPAWSAIVSKLTPKEDLGRISGLVQMADAIPNLLGPAIGGVLLMTIGLGRLVSIDFVSYMFAVALMFFVRLPRAAPSLISQESNKQTVWLDIQTGWTYITKRRGLLQLLIVFSAINLLGGMIWIPLQTMVLDTWSETVFGYLQSIAGIGMLAGTVIMSLWGGPQRRIYGLLGAEIVYGLFLMLIGIRASAVLLAIAGFGAMCAMAISNGCSQAIWQQKVEIEIQGRVFSIRRMIAFLTIPIGAAIAAPLTDNVFKPLLVEGGMLAGSLGPVFGVGPGRGAGLQITILGLSVIVVTLLALSNRHLRRLELDLPDRKEEGCF